MKFPKGYFEGEYREEFYVEPMMKRYWASQLEVLSMISSICNKHNIRYFALWGSLLGAVRHKGFVPWDDDIDIAMLREDFDKFFEVAKDELPQKSKLINIYTDPEWDVGIGRVTNYDGIIVNEEALQEYHGCPYATGIDIFPYDYLPDDLESVNYIDSVSDLIQTIQASIISTKAQNKSGEVEILNEEISTGLDYLEDIFGFQFNRSYHLINQLDCLCDQVFSTMGNSDSRYVTCYSERIKRKNKGRKDFKIPAFWLKETVHTKFENIEIQIPKYYEAVLSVCYGKNYMIPVKSGVAAHDYPLYKSQARFMEERGLDKLYEQIMLKYSDDYEDAEYVAPISFFIQNNVDNSNHIPKRILYCLSSMDVYNKGEKFIRKAESVLHQLDNRNDIVLYFSYDPLIYDMLGWEDSLLVYKFKMLIESYEDSTTVKKIPYTDVTKYVGAVDAYYGSCGECVKAFQLQNKPIMIQNLDIL